MLGAALAAGLVLAAAGCGSHPTASAPPATTPPTAPAPPPAPKDGGCYTMTMKQAVAPTSSAPAKSCRSPHTTETYLVGTLDTLEGGHLLAVDSDRVAAQVATTCRDRLTPFLGGTPDQARLSMVRPVWFTPTVAQSDQGANWFRCDAVVVADSDSLATRTSSLKNALGHAGSRGALAMCGTDAPGAKDFHRVLCSARHSWRAIATVPLKGAHYPGVKVAKSAGQTRCEDAASAAAKDPLSFQWGYEWPTSEDWSLDQHYGICWTKGA
jgi:hypothetical protein